MTAPLDTAHRADEGMLYLHHAHCTTPSAHGVSDKRFRFYWWHFHERHIDECRASQEDTFSCLEVRHSGYPLGIGNGFPKAILPIWIANMLHSSLANDEHIHYREWNNIWQMTRSLSWILGHNIAN